MTELGSRWDTENPCQDSPVYCVPSCDIEMVKNSLGKLLQHIANDLALKDASSFIVLSSRHRLVSLVAVSGFSQYCVTLCRQFGLLKNERVTLLSPMDQMIAIQLCLAEKNKQETGDFDVEVSVVIQASKDIVNSKLMSNYDITSCTQESGICDLYKKFLEDSNAVDTCDVFNILKAAIAEKPSLMSQMLKQPLVVLDCPTSDVDRAMLQYFCQDRPVKIVSAEVALESEEILSVTIETGCLDTVLTGNDVKSTVKKPPSVTDAYVRTIYLSYLELLVNSRSELAMSRVFNVPERELTHAAFTDLKHLAREKNMTMYQTATSYIMKIRLGGKGYAPDLQNSLGAAVKGVGDFVSLMQRMETVLEEDLDIRSACRRVVSILRREMVKCRDSKIRQSSVDSVSEQLHEQIASIIDTLDNQIVDTPGKTASNGGSLTSRRARKALRRLLDKLATVNEDMCTLDHLTDIYSSQRTPLRFPSVMSQFRSPMEDLSETSPSSRFNQSLSQRVLNRSIKKQTPVYAKRYKSNCDWAEPLHSVDLVKNDDVFSPSAVFVLPSKTIMHAGTKFSSGEAAKALEEMLQKEESADKPSSVKRLSDVTNSDMPFTDTDSDHAKPVKQKKAGSKNQSEAVQENQTKKRALACDNQSGQPEKKKKGDQSKSCRRKLLPQVKGQQQLTNFFRV